MLPTLLGADDPAELVLEGGTHNMSSPPHDFLDRAFLPLLARMGAQVELSLERPGYYPAGGGRYRVRTAPSALRPLALEDPGELRELRAEAVVSLLPDSVARRELAVLADKLPLEPGRCRARREDRSRGPGNVVTVDVVSQNVTEVFTAFGRKGVPAEQIARKLAREVRRYRSSGAAAGEHLADQLLLPLALAGGGCFTTQRPTPHTTTNFRTIQAFLDVPFRVEAAGPDRHRIEVG